MKNRFKERKGKFVKGRGWVCDEENPEQPDKPLTYGELGKYKISSSPAQPREISAVMFSQKEKSPPPTPRVTSRFKMMKQPRSPRATRITVPQPRLK